MRKTIAMTRAILLISLTSLLQSIPSTALCIDSISSSLCGYTLAWEDDFSGPSIDTSKWVVASTRDPSTGDRVPGAVGRHLLNFDYSGYITEEDTFIENGSLVLRNQQRSFAGTSPAGTFAYTSGWVMSMNRMSINKGYVAFRAQFPSGDRVWPAVWMIADDLVWGPEWDIFEYFGSRDVGKDIMGNHLATDTYVSSDNDIKWNANWIRRFDQDYDCEAWHDYGFLWTETCAVFLIDDEVVTTIRRDESEQPELWPDEKVRLNIAPLASAYIPVQMYFVMNNGVKTSSPRGFSGNTQWPNSLVIDYFRVYNPPPTTPNIALCGSHAVRNRPVALWPAFLVVLAALLS